jgi:hypothetical protein
MKSFFLSTLKVTIFLIVRKLMSPSSLGSFNLPSLTLGEEDNWVIRDCSSSETIMVFILNGLMYLLLSFTPPIDLLIELPEFLNRLLELCASYCDSLSMLFSSNREFCFLAS